MKKARNAKFIYNENKECIGIDLGADFVAEHEFGIEGIKKMFGISEFRPKQVSKNFIKRIQDFFNKNEYEPVFGIEKRAITKLPLEKLSIRKIQRNKKVYYTFIADIYNSYTKNLPMELNMNYFCSEVNGEDVGTVWDGRCGFGIIVDKKHKKDLESIVKAFNNLDIVIGQASSMAFKNGGLVIMIKSKINKETADLIYKQDKEYYDLQVEVRNTGIEKRLADAGKKYYALIPEKDANGNFRFFLNPQEQEKYNYGWFTLKDLDDWVNDEGKIVMSQN